MVTVVADDADSVETEDGDAGRRADGIMRLADAKRTDKDAVVGKIYEEILPPFEFGRVQTQMARQVVTGKVREAERERQYEEFKDRVGEIVNGVVKRVEYGNVIVDLGRGEGIMRRDQSIPRENFNIGDRIRCYIYDVRRETKGPQIMLCRAHGGFMAKLFAQEVPEVYDGVIEIRAVARDPGSRAKMAVVSNDSSIDPVGACVGMRGSRVQAVVAELQGEKIDIIQWSPDEATFIVNAPGPRRSLQGGDGRGGRARRSGGAGRAAVAGHRPPRPERAPRLPADRLADRHHDREPGERAPPARVRRAHRPVPGSPGRGRGHRPAAGHRRLRHGRGRGLRRRRTRSPPSRASTRTPPRRSRPAPATSWTRKPPNYDAKRRELGVEDGLLEIEGVTLPMAVALGEGEREDRRGPGRPGARRPARLVRDQERRAGARAGHPGEPSTWRPTTPRP